MINNVLLNNNQKIPNICFGTFGISENNLNNTLDWGFNFIDTASYYNNHKIIKTVLNKKNKNKNKIYICTKLWINQLDKHNILNNCRLFLKEMDITVLDLLLIHWPIKEKSEFIIEDIWYELEKLVKLKLVKSIGVSNFGILDLQRLLHICTIKPAVNQILVNPYNTNETLVRFCQDNDITVMAYSPFGSDKKIFTENKIKSLANKYNVPVSSIILRWFIDNKIIPIPYTSSINHLKEYLDFNKFTLNENDKTIISSYNKNLTKIPSLVFGLFNIKHYYKYNTDKYKILLHNLNPQTIFTTDKGFLDKCKDTITNGDGYIVCDSVYSNEELNEIVEIYNSGGFNLLSFLLPYNLDKITKYLDNLLILTIIEYILGYDCKISIFKYVINTPLSEHIKVHRDHPVYEEPDLVHNINSNLPTSIHCIICLNDFQLNNGSTCILPKSYRTKEKPQHIDNIILAKKGSVIIGRGDNWHSNSINTSDKNSMRLVVEFVPSTTNRYPIFKDFLTKNLHRIDFDKISFKLLRLLAK